MRFWYVTVMQLLTTDGKRCTKIIFGPKRCLTVGEANELYKSKREEYFGTVEVPKADKDLYSVTRENY